MFATIDLTSVTGGITDLTTAVSGANGATLVIGAALGVAAIFFGGKLLWKGFKKFTG